MVVEFQVFVYLSFTLSYILIFNNLQIQYFPSFQKLKYPFAVCLFLYYKHSKNHPKILQKLLNQGWLTESFFDWMKSWLDI